MHKADELAVQYRNDVELEMAKNLETESAAHENSTHVLA